MLIDIFNDKGQSFGAAFFIFYHKANAINQEIKRLFGMKDNVNGKQVAAGCLSIVLMGVVMVADIHVFFKLLLFALLFFVGAIVTGAFED